MPNPIIIVQGGQWGSEAKGAVAGYLCEHDKIDIAVRTGATNAGHTVYAPSKDGMKAFKMQQLPVGFVQQNTTIIIGAGALIDPVILQREVGMLESAGYSVRNRLKIDRRAGLHLGVHADRSRSSDRHHNIGATGKGCSEALIDRIKNRGAGGILFGDSPFSNDYDVCDTEALLNFSYNEGAKILLEGTQGQLLDLYLGPYPYTTHKQTGPAQWMLECGLSPSLPTEIHMVVRTFPIRVAGNSGPMPNETSWPSVARTINFHRANAGLPNVVSYGAVREFEEAVRVFSRSFDLPEGSDGLDQHQWSPAQRVEFREALSELHAAAWLTLTDATKADLSRLFEMTTVTKKLRRIAHLDRATLEASARQIRPHVVDITFMNYLFPEWWYERPTNHHSNWHERADTLLMLEFLRHDIEEVCGAPVRLIGFGPEDRHFVDRLPK